MEIKIWRLSLIVQCLLSKCISGDILGDHMHFLQVNVLKRKLIAMLVHNYYTCTVTVFKLTNACFSFSCLNVALCVFRW